MPKRTKQPLKVMLNKQTQEKQSIWNPVVKVNNTYTLKRIGNEDYRVYPCVLLVHGVHHGIGSYPVYYTPEVLEASAEYWNSMPVTIGHPVNQKGKHIMCQEDGTIRQQWEVGYVNNAHVEDGKLKADLYLNISKVLKKQPDLFVYVDNGGQLEVSTGLLALERRELGQWNGEEYDAEITEIIPDHLALLPNSTGACSWADGCGVRINTAHKEDTPYEYLVTLYNEESLEQVVEAVRRYVDSLDKMRPDDEGYSVINFVRAVFTDSFVYSQEHRDTNPPANRLLKQEYTIEDGTLSLEGDPVEVVEDIRYKPKNNVIELAKQKTNTKENKTMAKTNEKQPCCEKRVTALITNEKSVFTEDDREWLQAMNEEQIEKLESTVVISNEENELKPKESKVEPKQNSAEQEWQDFMAKAPAQYREMINQGLQQLDKKRAELMTKITNSEGNVLTEEQLKAMDIVVLESVAALIPEKKVESNPGNFAYMSPAPVVNAESEEEAYVPQTLSSIGKKE